MAINLPKLPFKVPHLPFDRLGPRTRRILRYVGLGVFALVVFVFALQMTFPYGRVGDKVVEAMSEKYEVTISNVERGWMPGRVYFNSVSIRPRPTKPGENPAPFFIKRLEIDLGVLALIGGTISVDIDATLGDNRVGYGHLTGTLEIAKLGKGSIHANFGGSGIPSDALPMASLIGLPMTGKLNLGLNANLPMEKSKLGKSAINWQKASANVTLACPSACTFGDGKTKLKPLVKNTRNQAMVGEGIDFGKVTMDTLLAKVSMKSGKLTVDKFDTTSKDGVLKVDYTMTLEKEFGESMVAGCLRFKGSDDLMRREPKTHAALSTTGAELRSDGLFHIRLTDRFKDMKRLNQECGPGTNTNNGEDFSRSNRPNLTVQPDNGTPPPPPPSPTGSTGEVTKPLNTPEQPMPATPPQPAAGSHDAGVATGSAAPGGPPLPAGGSAAAPPGPGSGTHAPEGKNPGPPSGNIDTPPPAQQPPVE
jgi:type II secretion system protein N